MYTKNMNKVKVSSSPGLSIAAWLHAITAATASVGISNSKRPELERSDFIGNNLTAFGGTTS